jgi:3-oxoacid CoA-transferase
VFSVDAERGLTLEELSDGVELQEIVESTGCDFSVSDNLKPYATTAAAAVA